MISTIYVEREAAAHPRARELVARFRRATVVPCERYGEVFNRRAQSFRLQKRRPALILARKNGRFLLDTPAGYGFGATPGFYFSHMYNCLYDCRYCFLQGMYRSAHYVLFVNYEDFHEAIEQSIDRHRGAELHFFSGYDCDSLALEPVTGFAAAFLPLFRKHPRALLELRTKSTQVRSLLAAAPLPNCVVAFSFTPPAVARRMEHGVPALARRLQVMRRLQDAGWKLGLRFDPLLWDPDYARHYRDLFDQVFAVVDAAHVHSVSLGSFRLPRGYFDVIERRHPREPLLAAPLEEDGGVVSYRRSLRDELAGFCRELLLLRLPAERLFSCEAL
jgi:spore photoproduct lyase